MVVFLTDQYCSELAFIHGVHNISKAVMGAFYFDPFRSARKTPHFFFHFPRRQCFTCRQFRPSGRLDKRLARRPRSIQKEPTCPPAREPCEKRPLRRRPPRGAAQPPAHRRRPPGPPRGRCLPLRHMPGRAGRVPRPTHRGAVCTELYRPHQLGGAQRRLLLGRCGLWVGTLQRSCRVLNKPEL